MQGLLDFKAGLRSGCELGVLLSTSGVSKKYDGPPTRSGAARLARFPEAEGVFKG